MRHVTPDGLDRLELLLEQLRGIPELREKKRGVFYRKSKAFLHFHEDPAGLFADLRNGLVFDRHRVSTARERARFARVTRERARS